MSIFYNYESFFGRSKATHSPESSDGFDWGKWMWLIMVEKLCKELNMKPDEVYKTNYISCLNWLSMFWVREKNINKNVRKIK